MLKVLNSGFQLFPAEHFQSINDLKSEQDLEIVSKYFDYCDMQLETIMNGLNELSTTNEKDVSIAQFERAYQPLIENRLEDITGEMFLIQNLVASKDSKDKFASNINERIDMVTAMLLVVPEKVEKTKCMMRLYEVDNDYSN